MTTTDPTFDAFEQRLAAVLDAEAATTDVPVDGRARIDRRLTQRRRTRRTTWLAAAAALVLVAATVGLLLRDATDDSTPYVDTDSTGRMPLLGFENETWLIAAYTPGGGYVLVPNQTGSSPGGVVLNVTRTDVAYPNPGLQVTASGEEVIDGQRVETATATALDARGVETFRSPVLMWEPAPGYRAMLTGSSSLPPEAIAELRAALESVISVDQVTWERHLRAETSADGLVSDRPMLVLAPPDGFTQLVSVSGDAVLAHLAFAERSETVEIARLANGLVVDQTAATPVEVRGFAGLFVEGSGESASQLSWTEGGETYLLSVPWGTTAKAAADVAEALVRPGLEAWDALLFPTDPIDMDLLIGDGGSAP